MYFFKKTLLVLLCTLYALAADKVGLSLELGNELSFAQKTMLISRNGATLTYDFNNTTDKDTIKTIRLYLPPHSGLTKNYALYKDIKINAKAVNPKISVIAKIGNTDVTPILKSIGMSDYQIDMLPREKDNFHFSKKQIEQLSKSGILDKNKNISSKLSVSWVYEWEQLFKAHQNTKITYFHLIYISDPTYAGEPPAEYLAYDKIIKNADFCQNERTAQTLESAYDERKNAKAFTSLEDRVLDYLFADALEKPAKNFTITVSTYFGEKFALCIPADFSEEWQFRGSEFVLLRAELPNFKPDNNTSVYFLTSKLYGKNKFTPYDSAFKESNEINFERLLTVLYESYRDVEKLPGIGKALSEAFSKKYKEVYGEDVGFYDKQPANNDFTNRFISKKLDIKDQISTTNETLKNNNIDANLADMDNYAKTQVAGVGLTIRAIDGKFVIIGLIPESSAQKAKVKRGGVIKSVNSQNVKGMSIDEVIEALRGKAGSETLLELESGEKYKLVRLYFSDKGILTSRENGVLVIKVFNFNKDTAANLKTAILENSDAKGIVIDIRENSGGLLGAISDSLGIFIDKGKLLFTHGERSMGKFEKYTFNSDNKQKLKDKPIVVLVGDGTSSGASLFAGVIQKYRKALVVGGKTGNVLDTKIIYPLSKKYGLKISVGTLYYHDDTMATNFPVTPDIVFGESIGYDDALMQSIKLVLTNADNQSKQ